MTKPAARILVISHRKIRPIVPMSYFYEYEDLIGEVDHVDIVAPAMGKMPKVPTAGRIRSRIHRIKAAFSRVPRPQPVRLTQDYDLLFVISPFWRHSLDILQAVQGWRQRCRVKTLLVHEVWKSQVTQENAWVAKQCRDFDHVIAGLSDGASAVAEFLGRPCSYLSTGVDALRFAPTDLTADRPIDVMNIGRRNPQVHAALLEWAQRNKRWYFYDTAASGNMPDHSAHRTRLAGEIQRTKYFVAHLARFDDVEQRGDQEELAMRHFEGAATGAVLIGQPPSSPSRDEHFGWPDSIIPVATDSVEIVDLIEDLDRSTDQVARIRRENVRQCLLRHDWVYRWRKVLEIAGLQPTEELLAREAALLSKADAIK